TTTRPALAAVCILPNDVRDITRDLYRLKMDLWGPDAPELHAKRFITKRAVRDNNKKETVDRAIQIMGGYRALRVFSVVMEKPNKPLPEAPGKVGYHYFHILKRIHMYADLVYSGRSQETALR
ncbi:MAG: hypothetical protein ACYDHM_16420, partial [Acidiferrobacterales bacterium]